MSYILIVGAKSDIAKAIAREYAKAGYDLYLAARPSEELDLLANDLHIRYQIKTEVKPLDLAQFNTHKIFYDTLNPKPEGIIVVSGYMVDQTVCEQDFNQTLNTIQVNYTGAVSLLNIVANDMEKRGAGFIIGVSSVAGDRGRKANYIYGSAKAAFTAYLSGLRNRLFSHGVHVLTVKPGFVATKMTKNMDLPEKLTAQPEDVAKAIFKAQHSGKDILYTKPIWKLIMLIIRNIPERIFKRMSI